AGCYFEGDEPARWRSRALQEIPEQLQEQMLPDGGHYERSPQYHCLMVENILDILNLAQNNPSRIGKAFPAVLRQHAESALAFIEDIAPADTLLPLFNDSAQGIAPEVSALQRYAKHLFGYVVNAGSADPHVVCRADFGLIGFRTAQAALLFDCGEPGPKYQPGHTHCDLLSFELAWGGLPLIVDTGVCEYEPGPRRHYLRSTAAHNTISIDGLEQSEIWGEFRVARRARVTRGSIKLEGNFSGVASLKIEGSFEGFFPGTWRDRPGFRHQRQIYVKLVKGGIESLEVVDTIAEVFARSRSYCLESFLHFHPDVLPEVVDGKRVSISIEGGPLLELVPPESAELEIVESIYCPRFGEVINNKCLVVREQVTMPHRMVYRIRDLSAS
ncbi:MAG: alginate lyase family protein, partial [Pseudomonadales bacterium]